MAKKPYSCGERREGVMGGEEHEWAERRAMRDQMERDKKEKYKSADKD